MSVHLQQVEVVAQQLIQRQDSQALALLNI